MTDDKLMGCAEWARVACEGGMQAAAAVKQRPTAEAVKEFRTSLATAVRALRTVDDVLKESETLKLTG